MSAIYYVAALLLTAVLIVNADAASSAHEAAYERLGAQQRADAAVRSFLETITFGLYRGASEREAELEEILERARRHDWRAQLAAWLLAGASALFLAGTYVASRRAPDVGRDALVHAALGVAALFLAVGLSAPILELVAYQDVALLGTVVVKHESRGIVTTIGALGSSGHLLVAALLALFSLVTPIAKLALGFLAVRSASAPRRRRLVRAARVVGNYSMTDVFVVAVLISVFVMDAGRSTDARPGLALYFFAGYSLLALASGQLLARDPEPG